MEGGTLDKSGSMKKSSNVQSFAKNLPRRSQLGKSAANSNSTFERQKSAANSKCDLRQYKSAGNSYKSYGCQVHQLLPQSELIDLRVKTMTLPNVSIERLDAKYH